MNHLASVLFMSTYKAPSYGQISILPAAVLLPYFFSLFGKTKIL